MSETEKKLEVEKKRKRKPKNAEKEHPKLSNVIVHNVVITFLIMGISTIIAQAFFHYSRNSTSVAIIYVLTVMLIARYTTGYITGIIASIFGVFFVNYVFTYPYMNFNFSIDGYPVTFLGMLLVSSITSTTTTRFKKQNQLLNEREKLLVEAEKETMRANLLRAVSHDLRTPLTSIIGLADTALSDSPEITQEKRRELLEGIRDDANWLLNMVENLLSVTRIRVGDAHVNTSPEPLEEVVAEAVQRFRKRLPQGKVDVKIPDEFLMVPMDATLIEQVIINLLENAVYHSGTDEPIEFYVEKREDCVAFHIRDYGKGIDPERLKIIFDGAGMEPNASGDSHKGMGIGLTICKTIINAHNGSIEAANRLKGAEFIFTLPLEEEEEHDK
ncbi:DUF4118 domain-containing protein [Clostridium sp. AF32-12BH]|uniref:sensor histidine kinase n=1 Tax=Clostridium sp. AF32-12BH TaxID=2292006 RepID=UPI000E527850|nr:DUF4118 domain-containing protein [Clostridium sp. AF32-12BH]RHP42713.1 DUF4118 domain-containing protein [Clostridium sp. AF32-12BH]RHV69773.1 DUF4118 domain-containing protein [Clostridium sp. OM02-18AC]